MLRHSKTLQLFLSHRVELLSYASRITGDRSQAEDVLQEAWIRFRSTETGPQLEEPAGYLRRIVRNLALDGYRRKSLESRIFGQNAELQVAAIPGDAPTPETTALAQSELRVVLEALAQMPVRVRVPVEFKLG